MKRIEVPEGVRVRGRIIEDGFEKILSNDALEFVAGLQRAFGGRVAYNMECRKQQQSRCNNGELPAFDPSTKDIRDSDWTCSSPPQVVADRRVEITGPVERKMIINALNSGARVFMADFEDSLSPTWENIMRGHINLKDAVEGTTTYHDKARNKTYKLNPRTAVLFVRPRGWHLPESHVEIDGQPATACLVDFGLYWYHNHHTSGPSMQVLVHFSTSLRWSTLDLGLSLDQLFKRRLGQPSYLWGLVGGASSLCIAPPVLRLGTMSMEPYISHSKGGLESTSIVRCSVRKSRGYIEDSEGEQKGDCVDRDSAGGVSDA